MCFDEVGEGLLRGCLHYYCCFVGLRVWRFGVDRAKGKDFEVYLKSPAEMVEFGIRHSYLARFEICKIELQKHQNHGGLQVCSSFRRCYYEPHPPQDAQ